MLSSGGPQPPALFYVVPSSTSQIVCYFTPSSGATTYIERSTNGITWTLDGTIAPGGLSYTSTGLTRQTKYYYRVRRKQSGVFGPYKTGANNYTWPVDASAQNYANNALSFQSISAYQNTEMYYVDRLEQVMGFSGFNFSSFDNFMLFSPTACLANDWNGVLYDISANQSQSNLGGTLSSQGVEFAYDGYISIDYPNLGAGGAQPSQFVMQMNVQNYVEDVETVPFGNPLCGHVDGPNEFALYQLKSGLFDYLIGQNNSFAGASFITVGPPISQYVGFACGLDVNFGNNTVFKDAGTSASSGAAASGSWISSAYPLYLGAVNRNGSGYEQPGKFTLNVFYLTGSIITDSDRLDIYSAVAEWLINVGR